MLESLTEKLALIEAMPYPYALMLGLIVGSFINVIVTRLPLQFIETTTEDAGEPDAETLPPSALGLVMPRSRCPKCQTSIAWYDNIPVLSFLFLRGRCRHCHKKISWRYPLIEIITACLALAIVYKFGVTAQAFAVFLLTVWLISITIIDWDTMYIPDSLSLSGLWLGLLISTTSWGLVSPYHSIWGAAVGYLILYVIYHIHMWLTKKEGMGFGDFKLLAMLGAWLGIESLMAIIFYSSLAGSVFGIYHSIKNRSSQQAFAFGPWLCGAALLLVFWPELTQVFDFS